MQQHCKVKDLMESRDLVLQEAEDHRSAFTQLWYKNATQIDGECLLHPLEKHLQWLVTTEEETYKWIFIVPFNRSMLKSTWTTVNGNR